MCFRQFVVYFRVLRVTLCRTNSASSSTFTSRETCPPCSPREGDLRTRSPPASSTARAARPRGADTLGHTRVTAQARLQCKTRTPSEVLVDKTPSSTLGIPDELNCDGCPGGDGIRSSSPVTSENGVHAATALSRAGPRVRVGSDGMGEGLQATQIGKATDSVLLDHPNHIISCHSKRLLRIIAQNVWIKRRLMVG